MPIVTPPPDTKRLGKRATSGPRTWVQTERAAHEAWAMLIASHPRAAALLHHLVARMGPQNAVVVSQKTLAKLMGCGVRTVQRAVAALAKDRWIQIVQLNGPGTVSAYVINDRVAWGQARGAKPHVSAFSAMVVADIEDQPAETLHHDDLRTIPSLYANEEQLPSGPSDEPPSQGVLPGLEPPLPNTEG